MSLLHRLRSGTRRFDALSPGLKRPRAYFNWLRSNYEMATRSSRISAKPLKLTYDPTNVCQLRCPLCPTGLELQDRPFSQADLKSFRRLMDEVGDYVFFINFFNWGEPLINRHIAEFVEEASARRISSTISTNLSFDVPDERLRALVESGLNQLIVSLDGASVETAGTYRRRGDFDLVIENMRRIVQIKRELGSRTPYVVWRFLVFRFNEGELAEACRLARDIGVDRITFSPAFLDEGDFEVPEEDRRRMKDWVPTDPRLSYYDPEEAARAKPGELRKQGEEKGKEKGNVRARCDWHYMSSSINADGSVAPCCAMFDKKDDIGQFSGNGEGGYMSVVNNESYVAIRDHFAGRRKEPTGLSCDTCPAPNLMGYARDVNLWVLCTLAFGLRRVLLSPFAALRRRGALVESGPMDIQSPVPIEEAVEQLS